ncbi:MAG: C_GCAxxG_C_C family protein [Ruminococcus sp.]|uniref:C-GCAxxG-C-C family protein n=1 Tax=Ruminococcus sp. TaxID=41978 RepID=UPI0025F9B08E|nr:C-GCAxxG-C-C family protein [Ruminococcus sp.]MBO4866514.1 C_GCAxxG_C_C family protein [Ruminococcus sp.]
MNKKSDLAIENHKNGQSCSSAVLCAFIDDAGMTVDEAWNAAMRYAGGKMDKCGAVLAAELVLKRKFGEEIASKKIAELEKRFMEMNSSLMCRELKGIGTGKVLRTCRGCVTDASVILEDLLK